MPSEPFYRADCSCGWTLSRKKHASNLPPENNRSIAESGASAHQFTHDWKEDGHEVSKVREVKV